MSVGPMAHQGGWDEILVFALPLLIYAAVRLWERHRRDDPEGPDDDGTGSGTPDA